MPSTNQLNDQTGAECRCLGAGVHKGDLELFDFFSPFTAVLSCPDSFSLILRARVLLAPPREANLILILLIWDLKKNFALFYIFPPRGQGPGRVREV